jgi:ribosome modulation factor
MTEVAVSNLHKEEDEGYLAAEAGRSPAENPYPNGTIRHQDWRRGWQIRKAEARRAASSETRDGSEDEGYSAAEAGQSLSDNPYPSGTIRYDDWRRGWQVRSDEMQRAIRLGKVTKSPDMLPAAPRPGR